MANARGLRRAGFVVGVRNGVALTVPFYTFLTLNPNWRHSITLSLNTLYKSYRRCVREMRLY